MSFLLEALSTLPFYLPPTTIDQHPLLFLPIIGKKNSKELESRVRTARDNLRGSKNEFNKTEDDLKSLQSVGQIIGEVL
ncbi:unnamed protein product [Brassica rapa subsp. trilocularis]